MHGELTCRPFPRNRKTCFNAFFEFLFPDQLSIVPNAVVQIFIRWVGVILAMTLEKWEIHQQTFKEIDACPNNPPCLSNGNALWDRIGALRKHHLFQQINKKHRESNARKVRVKVFKATRLPRLLNQRHNISVHCREVFFLFLPISFLGALRWCRSAHLLNRFFIWLGPVFWGSSSKTNKEEDF